MTIDDVSSDPFGRESYCKMCRRFLFVSMKDFVFDHCDHLQRINSPQNVYLMSKRWSKPRIQYGLGRQGCQSSSGRGSRIATPQPRGGMWGKDLSMGTPNFTFSYINAFGSEKRFPEDSCSTSNMQGVPQTPSRDKSNHATSHSSRLSEIVKALGKLQVSAHEDSWDSFQIHRFH